LATEWRETRLGDVIELQRGFDLPAQARRPGHYPIVSSGGVTGNHDEAKAAGPGVVTGRYGTLGQVFYIREDFWPLNTTLFVRDFKGNDPLFTSYLLRTLDFSVYSDKAAVPGLNRNHLHEIRVRVPSLAEQRKIAGILGALDDKIELNRRIATTVELVGRLAYRSWREMQSENDFKPIRAVCHVLSGGTPSKTRDDLWSGPIPWISPKVMAEIHCDEPEAFVSPAAIGNGTRLAPAGCTLVMVRGMGLHVGVRASQAREDVAFNQDVKALRPIDLEPVLLLFAVLDAQEALLAHVESSGHGTGVLPTGALARHPIAVPPGPARKAIAGRLELLNGRIGVARAQARTLASLRDALLLRLLEGRLA